VLAVAQWGAFHGPVVFSLADVAHLLGSPLSRRALAMRRLGVSLAGAAMAGVVAAAVVLVGLAADGRGVEPGRAAGLVAGLAELGVLGVTAAWAVQQSVRSERTVRRLIWPVIVAAAGLVLVAEHGGDAGRTLAVWSGPWGWAVAPGAGNAADWRIAIGLLTVATAAAIAAAVRHAGDCSFERHLRRAEGRQGAIAGLMSFDMRTARRSMEAVAPRPPRTRAAALRRIRSLPVSAIVWRDCIAAATTPGQIAQGALLTGLGTLWCLRDPGRPVTVAAALGVVYIGASRVLGPLRLELDSPHRTRVMLKQSAGGVLAAHVVVPTLAVLLVCALAATGSSLAGRPPALGAALVTIAATPVAVGCAAMSARRGGRAPQSVVIVAMAVDPAGGGLALLQWLAFWPSVAAILGGTPILLAATGKGVPAAALALTGSAVTVALVRREPATPGDDGEA
jgi:hypothetical protein